MTRLRAGDTSVRATIIGGHMRLGMSIVAKYAYKYPYLTDDLVGAAMMGICQAVDWAKERMYDNNITPYIYRTCDSHIRELIEDRLTIRIPRKTYSTMREDEDTFVPLITTISARYDEDNPASELEYLTELEARTIEENPILFEELLGSLELATRDKIIVDMLMDGYSLNEIAEALGVSKQVASLWKQRIGDEIIRRDYASRRTKRHSTRRHTNGPASN